jgi:hypothetical protein
MEFAFGLYHKLKIYSLLRHGTGAIHAMLRIYLFNVVYNAVNYSRLKDEM